MVRTDRDRTLKVHENVTDNQFLCKGYRYGMFVGRSYIAHILSFYQRISLDAYEMHHFKTQGRYVFHFSWLPCSLILKKRLLHADIYSKIENCSVQAPSVNSCVILVNKRYPCDTNAYTNRWPHNREKWTKLSHSSERAPHAVKLNVASKVEARHGRFLFLLLLTLERIFVNVRAVMEE